MHRAGILQYDPLYRLETIENSWVTLQQHAYSTKFMLTEDQLDGLVLKLAGVSTIGHVYVNQHKIGQVDNVYRTFYLECPRDALKIGENDLTIDIESTVRHSYAQAANYTDDVIDDYFWTNMWLTPSWV